VHLWSDNKGALLVQCPSDANKDWLDELVRKRQSEFGRIGYAGVIASLVEQGVPSDEAASEFGHIGYAGAIASLVEQGVPLDEAALEFGRIGYSGMIASLVEEGIPLEEAEPELARRGHAGMIASLVEQGVPSEEAASELARRGHAGTIALLVEQGVPSEEAASELGGCGGAGNRLKGRFVDLHGYFVVQEIDKHNVPCNPQTDRKATSWRSIALYLASDNVRIGYAASSLVKKNSNQSEMLKRFAPKNQQDKRRWRVRWDTVFHPE
jgi:hypothetical protein